jgi:hypothetical protein
VSVFGTDLPTSALQQFRQLSRDQQTASESGRLEAPQDLCVRRLTTLHQSQISLRVNELALAEYMGKLMGADDCRKFICFRAGGGSGHGGDPKAKLSEGYGAV